MALATPGNITISRLYRVAGPNQTFQSDLGPVTFGPASFRLFGTITWTNTESTQHAVVLTVGGRETLLTSGATSAKDIFLANYTVPDLAARNVTVTVTLKSNTETSATATSVVSVNGGQNAAFTGQLSISGNDILLPAWSGASNKRVPGPEQIQFQLGQAITARDVQISDTQVPLGGLIENQTYRARYSLAAIIGAATSSYAITQTSLVRDGFTGAQSFVQNQRFIPVSFYNIAFTQPISTELFFDAPAPVVPFTATSATARALRNSGLRLKLDATYRATWAITSGNPGGFAIEYVPANFGTAVGPDEAYLVGTPTSTGSFTINLTATRADAAQTATATISLTVVDSLPRTVITTNSAIARDGVTTTTSDLVNIAFESTPSPATWNASGLPPGVTINEQGTITGRPTRIGTYFASVTARAADFETSLPTTIKFVVTSGTGAVVSDAASLRSPWLLNQWELTDLHIIARSRTVESTLFNSGSLRIKLGDAINFAVFFVDAANEVFALAPSRLRLTIRKADNLDDLIIFKSSTPPESETTEGQTYYLMPVTTGNREREVALEWAEDNGENEPLPCVADLDWTKDGKVYSSRTFPVLLELDVTRP
jgi:plastocyanin